MSTDGYPVLGPRDRWVGPWRRAFALLPTRIFDDSWVWLSHYEKRRYSWSTPNCYPFGSLTGRSWHRRRFGD